MVRFEHCPKGNPNSTLALGGHRWSLHQTFSKSKHWATAALCWNYYDCWWAFVAKQFWRWCFQPIQCFSEARTFLPDAKKRFYPYPVVDSFGWFMPVSASQSDGTKSCKFEDFQVISCGITMRRCEDLLVSFQPCYSWSFGARTFLEVGGVFSATTKINAFPGKNTKGVPKRHRHNQCWLASLTFGCRWQHATPIYNFSLQFWQETRCKVCIAQWPVMSLPHYTSTIETIISREHLS